MSPEILAALMFYRYVCQGYLDIVRWLCEIGGATHEVGRSRGVDMQSKGGWTPLSEPLF